jgi:hypothetical protein
VLDAQRLLAAQTFWDNRDWDWFARHVPAWDSPDAELNTTYYYRWELLTKHLTYGSPQSGYSFTEFIDRPFWSGAYGAISCPAGHQLYEARWLRDPQVVRDYGRYWFRTPGAQPRRYSCWLADALWAAHCVHPDRAYLQELLPDLQANFAAWEESNFVPGVGMFWQTGHDDGMEYNINSRQTSDIVRGAPGYRVTLNSYLWADAKAIERIARLSGDAATAEGFAAKAAALKQALQSQLWDPRRAFFFQKFQRDELLDGQRVAAGSLTYQTGKYAGSPHGRELYGYVPWQFNLPDRGFEEAWKFLMDEKYFRARFGPTTTERGDPQFLVTKSCCWWSGQSWPYATTQTLAAMANLLCNYTQQHVTKADYYQLLRTYSLTHRKAGRPYLAEAANPDTGSWEGYDAYHHSEHYFHSAFCDLVVTGLVGIKPRDDEVLEVQPLAPDEWDYFALDGVAYRGREVAVVWDRLGTRYGLGPGLHLVVDGRKLASSPRLERLTAELPRAPHRPPPTRRFNYAVNNDGEYYPRLNASYSAPQTSPAKVQDGNYWYHEHPPNRWTSDGSTAQSDTLTLDLGMPRQVDELRLYLLDDGQRITPPQSFQVEHWDGGEWRSVPGQSRLPQIPTGRRANVVRFPPLSVRRLRVVLEHAAAGRSGLTEWEVWGDGSVPYRAPDPPPGNLAVNRAGQGFPRATASHTSRFDRVEMANDGRTSFLNQPHNRWTSYESPQASDWLQIDLGADHEVGRVDLALYDDGGGVQAPEKLQIQVWDGRQWQEVRQARSEPDRPVGGVVNTTRFERVRTSKLRVVFTHRGQSRSGVSEIEIWRE